MSSWPIVNSEFKVNIRADKRIDARDLQRLLEHSDWPLACQAVVDSLRVTETEDSKTIGEIFAAADATVAPVQTESLGVGCPCRPVGICCDPCWSIRCRAEKRGWDKGAAKAKAMRRAEYERLKKEFEGK